MYVLDKKIETHIGKLNKIETDRKISFVRQLQQELVEKEKAKILSQLEGIGINVAKVKFFSFPDQKKYSGILAKFLEKQINNFLMQKILHADENLLVREWTNGLSFAESLSDGNYDFIETYFNSIFVTHKNDLFYADGWPENLIVTKDGKLVRFDIDFMVQDREFELAQAVFHVICFSKNPAAVSRMIKNIAIENKLPSMYEIVKMKHYLSRYIKTRLIPFLENKKDTLYFYSKNVNKTKKEHYSEVLEALKRLLSVI